MTDIVARPIRRSYDPARGSRGVFGDFPAAVFAPGTIFPPCPAPVPFPCTPDGQYVYSLEDSARLGRNAYGGYRGLILCTPSSVQQVEGGPGQENLAGVAERFPADFVIVCERCMILFLDPHAAAAHSATHREDEPLPCHAGCKGIFDSHSARVSHWQTSLRCGELHVAILEAAMREAFHAVYTPAPARM